ncbi:hypothetical protein J8273_7190 [Carpediemonas membranifera]|uniref:Uncharacterized protein n=1 Tax=Carpediemonas membranifera TaxID=201153 RepID=A0A8J6E1Q1_9EUKA|nr:hypothetical protein J8273_7190 [Carpediemonas membranifera]|eukprot:KAG9390922.1 hypothetical protein J8273_7190 [Carpediemonas membranifera]
MEFRMRGPYRVESIDEHDTFSLLNPVTNVVVRRHASRLFRIAHPLTREQARHHFMSDSTFAVVEAIHDWRLRATGEPEFHVAFVGTDSDEHEWYAAADLKTNDVFVKYIAGNSAAADACKRFETSSQSRSE